MEYGGGILKFGWEGYFAPIKTFDYLIVFQDMDLNKYTYNLLITLVYN